MARGEVDDQGDALEASDEGARLLFEGRYAQVNADRPGMVERAWGFMRTRERWTAHLHGWSCSRCGPTCHSRKAAHRHDWWHRWLERMFAAVGTDVDKLEGELLDLRAEVDQLRGELAVVERVTAAFGPVLAHVLEDGERVVQP